MKPLRVQHFPVQRLSDSSIERAALLLYAHGWFDVVQLVILSSMESQPFQIRSILC
jgi:hypothetical protein